MIETFLFNLDWFHNLSHSKRPFLFHQKFPLLSYDLKTVKKWCKKFELKFLENTFWRCRSICLQMFFKISVLENFAIFTRKYRCWSLFLIKLHTHMALKKRLKHMCLPVNITKFLRIAFLWNNPMAVLKMVEWSLRISNLTIERFVKNL